MKLSDIATLNMKFVDYCRIISGISQSYIIRLMKNIGLMKKCGML